MAIEFHKLIPHDTNIDFVGKRNYVFGFSVIVTIISILAFVFNGLNYGVDFRGGFVFEIRTPEKVDISGLREKLHDLDVGEFSLQEFGSDRDVLIRMPSSCGSEQQQIVALEKVKKALGDRIEYRKIERIGPKIGKELVNDAMLAVVISLLAILLYVWIRFEWQFAVCGVTALAHDCVILMGLYSIFHYFEFSANSIVAFLMTASYSIHDTVVIFDRIREDMRSHRNLSVAALLNKALNETLSRTMLTALTTVMSLLALCIFGGKIIFDFCFPIMFGLVFGTFSSICLSAPLLLFTGIRVDGRDLELGLEKNNKTA